MSVPRADIPPGYFVEVRDPHTMKLVCRVNPHTGEVVTVGRSGDVRRGTLPPLALPAPVRPPAVGDDAGAP